MRSTRIVLIVFISMIYLNLLENISAQDSVPVIRFGLIADIQYADCDRSGSRYYRNSLEKLNDCISDFNNRKVQFVANLGDLIDRSPEDLDSVLLGLKRSKAKVYNMTGNHDYGGFDNNKILYKKLGMPSEYYSFKKKNWRFVILNTNEIASYSNITGTAKEKDLQIMLDKIKTAGLKNGAGYNGGISKKQMDWLRAELEKAQGKGENVIVFSHHPLYPQTALTALNGMEIIELINDFSCVKLLLSGHHHPGEFAWNGNIPAVTLEGMIETEDQNAYGVVDIYPDRIIISGTGRLTSREFKLE